MKIYYLMKTNTSVVFLDDSVKHIFGDIAEELTEDVTALVHFADILLLD